MPLVKQVSVRISTDGAADAKLKIDAVGARAEEIAKLDPTIRVRVDTAAASVKLAILRAELRRTAGETGFGGGGGGGGGKGGLISRVLGGLGGINVPLGPLGSAPLPVVAGAAGVLAAAPGPVPIIAGTLGVIPLLAAASAGVASFGALALPTFTKITTAVTAIGAATNKVARDKAWDAIPKSLQPAVHGVLGLQSAFDGLVLKLQPLVLKIAGVGLAITNKLMPILLPFAQIAGKAILGLLQNFDKFASSPGFKAFISEMERLAGPAIATIGEGIGKVAIAIGKLLEKLVQPRSITYLKDLFRVVATVIESFGALIHALGTFANVSGRILLHDIPQWTHTAFSAWRSAWDGMTGTLGKAAGFIAGVIGGIGRTIAGWASAVGSAVNRAVGWFAGLPRRIAGAVGNLGGLLIGAGEAILGGLLQGLENAWNSVASFLGGLAHKIASLKGPLPKDATLLVPHGKAIMGGLITGMGSMLPALEGMAGQATAAIAGGIGYGGAGGTAYVTYAVNVSVPPNVNLAEVGRVTVQAIEAFEKRSGKSWRTR